MKKIGEIKGVPVVEGNINEVTKNQIHYKEDSGNIQLSKRGNDNKLNSVTGSSGGGSSRVEYYNVINEDKFNAMLDITIFHMGCKCIVDGIKRIASAMYTTLGIAKIVSISYYPTNLALNDIEILLSDNFYNAFYKFVKMIQSEVSDEQIKELFDSTFVTITEEEFYNLD